MPPWSHTSLKRILFVSLHFAPRCFPQHYPKKYSSLFEDIWTTLLGNKFEKEFFCKTRLKQGQNNMQGTAQTPRRGLSGGHQEGVVQQLPPVEEHRAGLAEVGAVGGVPPVEEAQPDVATGPGVLGGPGGGDVHWIGPSSPEDHPPPPSPHTPSDVCGAPFFQGRCRKWAKFWLCPGGGSPQTPLPARIIKDILFFGVFPLKNGPRIRILGRNLGGGGALAKINVPGQANQTNIGASSSHKGTDKGNPKKKNKQNWRIP